MKTGAVYGLLCPLEKRIVYVGQTAKSLSNRLSQHKASIRDKSKNSKRVNWLRELHTASLIDDVMVVCLRDNVPLNKLTEIENFWIAKLGSDTPLLNDNRKNTMPRPSDKEDGLRCKKIHIPTRLIRFMHEKLSEFGIDQFSKASGLSKLQIYLCKKDMVATSSVISILEKTQGSDFVWKAPEAKKFNYKNFSSQLKRRPDYESWITEETSAL